VKPPKYLAPALGKGLEIIELLANELEPLIPAQIAKKLNRSTSEIYRILLILNNRHYIKKMAGTGGFMLENKLLSFGTKNSSGQNFVNSAVHVMKELTNQTQRPCYTSILADNQAMIVAKTDSNTGYEITIKPGFTDSVIDANSGPAIFSSADIVMQTILLNLMKETNNEAELKSFMEKVDGVSQNGYSVQKFKSVGISAPIVHASNQAAALSMIIFPDSNPDCSIEELTKRVKKAALQFQASG